MLHEVKPMIVECDVCKKFRLWHKRADKAEPLPEPFAWVTIEGAQRVFCQDCREARNKAMKHGS